MVIECPAGECIQVKSPAQPPVPSAQGNVQAVQHLVPHQEHRFSLPPHEQQARVGAQGVLQVVGVFEGVGDLQVELLAEHLDLTNGNIPTGLGLAGVQEQAGKNEEPGQFGDCVEGGLSGAVHGERVAQDGRPTPLRGGAALT